MICGRRSYDHRKGILLEMDADNDVNYSNYLSWSQQTELSFNYRLRVTSFVSYFFFWLIFIHRSSLRLVHIQHQDTVKTGHFAHKYNYC